MARKGVKPKDLAKHLGVRRATIYDKLNGRYDFSFTEALSIKSHFFKEHELEYLFNKEIKERKKTNE